MNSHSNQSGLQGTEAEQAVQAAPAVPAASHRRHLLQSALGTIERLQARLDDAERSRREPIAIVGMGCRAPGGVIDAESYWKLLAEGRDVVSEIPADRWDVDAYYDPDPSKIGKSRTKSGGFLDEIDGFDPGFFGVSPREATGLDPQQRLLLEVAWEALEDAAIPPAGLDGSQTGIFVGITSTDYARRIDVADPARSDIYLATGTALNAAAGRISFTLGLQGPCMAIDTACSSSLVAIHTACQSLRNGESDLALAGGVNVMLAPEAYILISKWGMLSPDGRCKAFDDSANGFVRGEGCGLVVLERLSSAMANGRRILAVIRGSAINQDGRSSGLTAPNGLAQQAVVRRALQAANLRAGDVSYVEAHGTGTALGDPIEIEALAAVYGAARPLETPLEIGSVKSNIGHLEAASGVMGMCKVVLAMHHRQLPASLHVKQPTRAIDWDAIPLRVSTSLHDWPAIAGRRIAGVSAFGFSGMNAHLILEEAPAQAMAPTQPHRALQVLPLSARSDVALAELASRFHNHLQAHPDQALADICRTAATGRSHLSQRVALVARDREDMLAQLRSFPDAAAKLIKGQAPAGGRARVGFLFSGQGSQYCGMGRELYQTEPAFRDAFDRCLAVLDPLLERSLKDVMFGEEDGTLDQTGYTQPALYTLQVCLATLWQAWGIEPTLVIGHSVGEFAAAAVAGVFSIEDGARLVAARGRLMQALPAGGAMVAVQGDTAAVELAVSGHSSCVSIAARNAPGSLVIAGAGDEVGALADRLSKEGMRVKPLTVSHAFHSPLMEPMLAAFKRIAGDVVHQPPRLNWISNLTGDSFDWAVHGAHMDEYWTRHVREPVAFEQGMRTAGGGGCNAYVEIGPSPVLLGLGALCLGDAAEAAWLPSLKRGQSEVAQMVDSAARLFVNGAPLNWSAFEGTATSRPVALPTYPFQRDRFLIGPLDPKRRAPGRIVHPLLGERLCLAGAGTYFESRLSQAEPGWIADHRIGSDVVLPMTAYLEMALAAAGEAGGTAPGGVDAIEIHEPMVFQGEEERVLQVVVGPAEGAAPGIRIFSRVAGSDDSPWTLHATASAAMSDAEGAPGYPASGAADLESMDAVDRRCDLEVDCNNFYDQLQALGVHFGPAFQGMRQIWSGGPGEALGDVVITPAVAMDAGDYSMHPALLDACLHAASNAMETLPGTDDGRIYLPVGLDSYRWLAKPSGPVLSHARVREPVARQETVVLDVRISTHDGAPVAMLSGLRCRRVSKDAFRHRMESKTSDMLYESVWKAKPAAAPAAAAANGTWLILDEGAGRGAALAMEIDRRGGTAVRVVPHTPDAGAADPVAAGCFGVQPDRVEDLQRLLAELGAGSTIAGVVNLWPLRMPALDASGLPGHQQQLGAQALLLLVQALAAAGFQEAPRLWVLTQGAHQVDGTETIRLEQAPVIGVAKVAAVEHPELRVSCVDLDPQAIASDTNALVEELLGTAGEGQVAFRKGGRFVSRLARKRIRAGDDVDLNPVRLSIASRGTLENLAVHPMQRRAPGPGEIEIRVRASGLNFRDVLSALGMYPGELGQLGSDCAGEVVALGEGVEGFAVGDRVVAMAEGTFASHATARWEFVAPLPAGLDFEQGAAIPTAYLTADITLNRIALMKQGDRVLIHSGAGGVGMAAIALARRAGATVFATAGSAEKRAFLARLGVHHVFDSRTAGFADEILRLTGGDGVDIVLNSLTGEMLDRSFEVLGEGGVFLEIGKRDLWTHEQAEQLGRGIRYHIVDCNDNARETPEMVGEIFTRVLREIEAGELPILPCTTFAFERAAEAFRFMAQAKHIGRVVFRHRAMQKRRERPIDDGATYLVTGGLKGLGRLAAQWLAGEGARHLLLAGRAEPDAEALAAIEAMQAEGVEVAMVAADVSTAAGVERLMARLRGMPALGGVVHCAGVLDDGVLLKQTPGRLAGVMAPKADGAWLIHQALLAHEHQPDFFLLYSSMSSVFGAAGQANYVAANSFLDALARYRHTLGLPCTSVNWGAWSEVGMAARGVTVDRAAAEGIGAITPAQGALVLGVLLREASPQVAVTPIDWSLLVSRLDGRQPAALLEDLVDEERGRSARQPAQAGARRGPMDLSLLEPVLRLKRLAEVVRQELATVLALGSASSAIGDEDSFTSLGLDSLTAVELRNRLQQMLGRPLPATAAFEWPSIDALARGLSGLYGNAVEAAAVEGEEGEREELIL